MERIGRDLAEVMGVVVAAQIEFQNSEVRQNAAAIAMPVEQFRDFQEYMNK